MFKVDKEKCVGCSACLNVCPVSAISMTDGKAEIDVAACSNCGRCAQVCPQGAIYSDMKTQGRFVPNQEQVFPKPGFGMGGGIGRGLGRGMGRGLGRGPRDGRGRGRGGGGRK